MKRSSVNPFLAIPPISQRKDNEDDTAVNDTRSTAATDDSVKPIPSPATSHAKKSVAINGPQVDENKIIPPRDEVPVKAADETLLKEPILSDEEYLRKVLPQITACMNRLSSADDFLNEKCFTDLNDLQKASRFGTFEQRAKVAEELMNLGVAELFQRIWQNYFEMEFLNKDNKQMSNVMAMVLVVMWNYSDKSTALCERVHRIELYGNILSYLDSQYLSPSTTSQARHKQLVSGLMGILHNMVQKIPESKESVRGKKAVDILQRFRNAPNIMVACKALIIQGYLITEEENEIVNSDASAFKFMIRMLKNALSFSDHFAKLFGFRAVEVIVALNRLAVNDNNQIRIVTSGALPYYVLLLQPGCSTAEQAAAAEGLWTLEFKCMKEVEEEPGCIAALENLLSTSSDEMVVTQAKGALWMLQENNRKPPPTSSTGDVVGDKGHVFISYQWDSKPIIMKLWESLVKAGYQVWVDVEKMSGSVLEAMAEAVENAVCVIVCLTQKYKESPNTRTEAEYTFRLHKTIIPLRLQPRYMADGWLGALTGNQLVFDFSSMDKFENSFKNLVKELGNRGKQLATDAADGLIKRDTVSNTATQSPHNNNNNSDKSKPNLSRIASWSVEDVSIWLNNSDIGHLKNWLSEVDGSLLVEYKLMRENAPETFYGMLKENGFNLVDILKLSKAMNQL